MSKIIKHDFFMFNFAELRKQFCQEQVKYLVLFPIFHANEFSGRGLSRLAETTSSLCFNFTVIIRVWTLFLIVKIVSIKFFLYKESFAASEVKASDKEFACCT